MPKRSLRGRLRRHALRDRQRGKWDSFLFTKFGTTKYIKDIESLMLRVFRPEGNRVVGRFKKRYNGQEEWLNNGNRPFNRGVQKDYTDVPDEE